MNYPGVLHQFVDTLSAFEFTTSATPIENVVVFVGGLEDGLLTVPYVPQLAKSLPSNWVLIQTLISSSYRGWGTGSLKRDTKEIGKLISYLRSEKGGSRKKIILMGHSTGCQDTLYYLTKYLSGNSDPLVQIDGGILQAPVSDREAFLSPDKAEYITSLLQQSQKLIEQGKGETLLPQDARELMWNTPISAYRFWSLLSERGDDDYFSSYLDASDHSKSFGVVNKPIMILYGGKDEFVPALVDREALVASWKKSTPEKYWSPLSKVLKGAKHNVGPGSDEGAVADLIDTVKGFIEDVEKR